jgi:hypothetical protein
MPALEWKFGISIVVKTHLLPVLGRMAGVTFLAVPPAVCIVQAMACVTVGGRVLIPFVGMTTVTRHLLVPAP